MCTWFSASWRRFRYDRKCLFSCIYNLQITISPTSLFSANFNGNHGKNHPKPWTCPLSTMLLTVITYPFIVCFLTILNYLSSKMETHKRLKITVTVLKYLLGGKIQTNKMFKRTAILIGQHKTLMYQFSGQAPLAKICSRFVLCDLNRRSFFGILCWDLQCFRTLAVNFVFVRFVLDLNKQK